MSKLFSNQVIFITGASAGFGEATARLFAKEGANLVLMARREEKLQALANELSQAYKIECIPLSLDVRNYDEISKAFESLPEKLAVPDILINNAGLVRGLDKLWEISEDKWNDMIDINIKGILNLTRILLPKMLQNDKGQIINIGSISGHETYPGGGVYCATKHAVRALTDTLRKELVATPIKVSLVSPGMAETEFSIIRFDGDEARAKKVYEGLEPLVANDIAETILFIASRPPHVNIADIIIFPKAQASTTLIHRK